MTSVLRPALRAALALQLAAATSIGAAAQQQEAVEQWQALLKLQLKQSYNCDLATILYVRDVPVGNLTSMEGRIRCIDEREFEFSRMRSHEKFTIHLCQPAVC
ncbi:MAG: hypothetical protein AB1749_02545 [Pseudomonadota bacterium]